MKRCISIFIALIFAGSMPFYASAENGAFLIMDGRTALILEQENCDQRLPMASTTKVMTALVTLKHSDLTDAVRIPTEAAGVEGSSLYIKTGEVYTVEELLYGLMLRSANDCAVALACHVGGSVGEFAEMMNREAKDLGLKNTQFKNPNGLPADGHYTTAYELALIMKAAMENEKFRAITAAKSHEVKGETITNHNRLLSMYSGCIGGKTGYTIEAGRCLVSIAQRDAIPLICVTLGRRDDWNIHVNAYEKWFAQVETLTVAEKSSFSVELPLAGKGTVSAFNSDRVVAKVFKHRQSVTAKVLAGPFVYGNKEKGAVVGTVEFWCCDTKIGESPLIIAQKIETPVKKELFITRIIRFFRGLFLKKN